MKTDPNQIQGIPDLIVIYKNKYALLEVKRSTKAPRQPNQGIYVDKYRQWTFASFISPENKRSVLDGMEQALRADGPTCTI